MGERRGRAGSGANKWEEKSREGKKTEDRKKGRDRPRANQAVSSQWRREAGKARYTEGKKKQKAPRQRVDKKKQVYLS